MFLIYDVFACSTIVFLGTVLFHLVLKVVRWRRWWTCHRFWRSLILVLWPPCVRQKIKTSDSRRCKFIFDEVDNLCAHIALNNKFDSPNDGYCLITCVTSIRYIISLLHLSLHIFRTIAESHKTGANSTEEETNEAFRCSGFLTSISVQWILTLRQDKNGFSLEFTFETFPWSFNKYDSIVSWRRRNWGKGFRESYYSTQ